NLDAKLRVQMRTEVAELQDRLGTTTVYVTHDQTEAMTLGDRVAVMKSGVLQQVDSPGNLYNDPVNLFVAGFIGSPSMNFIHGQVNGGEVELPFATIPLNDDLKGAAGGDREVICGIRPEHFEDAELIGDHLGDGVTFEAKINLVESMGSELYAYFESGSEESGKVEEAASAAGLEALAGGDAGQVVTRLPPESKAKRGETLKFWVDPDRLLFFDPESGNRLKS
ncbi:MAG: ABC transporter ATP-binding protein, partial [Solirubrobacterales bacterium]|nr:ABC transporter ATP-binding protein [Solirubrobacterales bacterium]